MNDVDNETKIKVFDAMFDECKMNKDEYELQHLGEKLYVIFANNGITFGGVFDGD